MMAATETAFATVQKHIMPANATFRINYSHATGHSTVHYYSITTEYSIVSPVGRKSSTAKTASGTSILMMLFDISNRKVQIH